jgi:hypothetical protein
MSHRNGNRSRFDRQRNAKLQNRMRIREFRKTLKSNSPASEVTSQSESKATPRKSKS